MYSGVTFCVYCKNPLQRPGFLSFQRCVLDGLKLGEWGGGGVGLISWGSKRNNKK